MNFDNGLVLYDYWRSSASYRVRIALGLLDRPYQVKPVDLLKQEQRAQAHMTRNPQGLLPTLFIDGKYLSQSLAIIEYLHETAERSNLLPPDADGKHFVRTISYAIAMEIHPVCNLSVVSHVEAIADDKAQVKANWMKKFIGEGLQPVEQLLATGPSGEYCFGDQPGIADCCLIPQVYNAHRWGVDLTELPHIERIDANCQDLLAFKNALPEANKV
jgi:maleylacetoacetate isomerase